MGAPAGREPGPMLEYLVDPDARTLAQLIVAFANSAGGTIIVGLDEHGRLDPSAGDDLEPVLQRAIGFCEPRFGEGDAPRLFYEETAQGQFATIVVRPLPYRMSIEGREVYLRSGRSNMRVPAEEMDRVPPAHVSFEDSIVAGATLDDLDDAVIEEYRQNRIRRGPRGESFTRSELLRDAGAIDVGGRPTATGILLFGRNPQQFFPQVGAVIVRFRGNSLREAARGAERYSKRVEVAGPLPRLVEAAWQALFDEIHGSSVTNGLTREERYEYPLEAVREAVVNAVCHRDYALTGQRIEIHLFDGHMEITSPGRLPGHITLDNILDEHYSRNPRLVRGLYYWGYIEELGQGVDIIYDAMRRDHHPDPEFRETGRSFMVTLRNAVDDLAQEMGADTNPRQLRALRYIRSHGRLTHARYRQLCPDATPEALRLDLHDLVERGILLRIGGPRGTIYVLK